MGGGEPPKEKHSMMGLCFPVMQKYGDVWRRDEHRALEKFTIRVDSKFRVAGEHSLRWDAYLHISVQRRCEELRRARG